MAWKKKTLKGGRVVMWEDVALGGTTLGIRYTSEFQVPPGRDFVIITNALQKNTSGTSCSDRMYVGYESGGTFTLYNNHLRSVGQGTSFNPVDNNVRIRKWDISQNITASPMAEFPYYKLAIMHTGVDSSSEKIRFVVMYNAKAAPLGEGGKVNA